MHRSDVIVHHPHSGPYRRPLSETALTKVFVGGLAWETTSASLGDHFIVYGEILEAVVIADRSTGRSKGYGFVTFKDPDAAAKATMDANPVIDSRRANCILAAQGARKEANPSQWPYGYYIVYTYPGMDDSNHIGFVPVFFVPGKPPNP